MADRRSKKELDLEGGCKVYHGLVNTTGSEIFGDMRWSGGRRIGPIGTIVRILVLVFLLQRIFLAAAPPLWWQYLLGLIGLPIAFVVAQAAYARWRPAPSPWIGPIALAVVAAVVAALYFHPALRPAIGLTIALMILLAAIRGNPDCEGTVIGNWLLRRGDRVWCPFSLVDVLERRLRRRHPA